MKGSGTLPPCRGSRKLFHGTSDCPDEACRYTEKAVKTGKLRARRNFRHALAKLLLRNGQTEVNEDVAQTQAFTSYPRSSSNQHLHRNDSAEHGPSIGGRLPFRTRQAGRLEQSMSFPLPWVKRRTFNRNSKFASVRSGATAITSATHSRFWPLFLQHCPQFRSPSMLILIQNDLHV
jgi:hypothetical protein